MTNKFLLIFTILSILANINGLCNVCQKNYAACLDEKRFVMCAGGKPEDKIQSCPDGYVCTTKSSICLKQSESNPVTPSCEMSCGLCNSPGKLFSCLSSRTYAFCFGEDVPDLSAKGVCPNGYVCNLKTREVCKKATDVDVPSCNAEFDQNDSIATSGTIESPITTLKPKVTTSYSSTTIATHDESVITDGPISTPAMVDISVTSQTQSTLSTTQKTVESEYESSICTQKKSEGPYRLEKDSSCRKFILCYFLAGQFLELHYTCSGSDYFNDETKKCQTEKPLDCY